MGKASDRQWPHREGGLVKAAPCSFSDSPSSTGSSSTQARAWLCHSPDGLGNTPEPRCGGGAGSYYQMLRRVEFQVCLCL